MQNLFAFTETNYAPADYPAFLSLNEHEDGRHTLTVRSRGSQTPQEIELPPMAWRALASAIRYELLRENGAGG